MTTDLVIGNLDAETQWARRAGHAVRALPAAVLERVSLYATLVRALWPDAHRVWTPAPFSAQGVRVVRGLPSIEEGLSGALVAPEANSARRWAVAPPWRGDEALLDAAMRVNDRRFGHDLAVELDVQIPGSAIVASFDEVMDCVRSHPRWVLKTPFGTAGRGFVHGREGTLDDPNGARRIRRLLDTFGALLFQPWLTRRVDIGLVVDAADRVQMHRIHSGSSGQFGGISVGPDADVDSHGPRLREIARVVSARLRREGYVGPFGIDAFVDATGVLVPLCEINARHTFGHVAHALVAVQGMRAGTLRFGDVPRAADERGVIPLLGSDDRLRTYAWLTLDSGA